MIYVAPLHEGDPATVSRLCWLAEDIFRIEAKRMRTSFDPESTFDTTRQQYSSTQLLERLLGELPHPGDKLVAVTDVDLFIPVLTFVFGEAQLDGNVAVASSFRLREAFYGLPDNPDLTVERLEKEVIHELGHTFGLKHCENYQCVMHPSTGVEEIDLKSCYPCALCERHLESRRNGSVG